MLAKIKKRLPTTTLKFLVRNRDKILRPSRDKVFCISFQRNGTTSVGDFLRAHKYNVARYTDARFYGWGYLVSIGDLEAIFRSNRFKAYNAFEDGPWFTPDLYKILFHRFPKSKFILLDRDSNKWFDSMSRHSGGRILGNTRRHCKLYRRMPEFYHLLDSDPSFQPSEREQDSLLSLEGMRDHYIPIYEEYNREVVEFFERYGPERLFHTDLTDPDKWTKMGDFLHIKVKPGYDVQSNSTLARKRSAKNKKI